MKFYRKKKMSYQDTEYGEENENKKINLITN